MNKTSIAAATFILLLSVASSAYAGGVQELPVGCRITKNTPVVSGHTFETKIGKKKVRFISPNGVYKVLTIGNSSTYMRCTSYKVAGSRGYMPIPFGKKS